MLGIKAQEEKILLPRTYAGDMFCCANVSPAYVLERWHVLGCFEAAVSERVV